MNLIRRMEDYEKLVKTMAWKFLPKFRGIKEIEDLIQDGWEVFTELKEQEKQKPLNCQFGTALSIQIKQKWQDEIKRFSAEKRLDKSLISSLFDNNEKEPTNVFLSHDPTSRFDTYLSLSEEMKVVIQLIKDAPSELAELCETISLRRSIGVYVRKILGWKFDKAQKLDDELSSMTKSYFF